MARLRGFERYNNPSVGCDLVIKKLNPGVDEGVGYLVSVFQDGDFKDRLKITSKKKLKELIDSFKEYYKTDKAFLNGMLFHITYKDEKEQKMPKKHLAPEEKHNEENEDKEAMVTNIDESLYRKAAVIERHLNRLFDPELPSVVRTAEEQGQPSGNITEEFVRKSKEEIEKFVAANKELAEGSESYQLYNALQRWVADVNAKIDDGEYQGLDADKAKADLADYFSNYEFLKEKRAASSTVIITDDNIEQLLDSLDSAVNIDPTDSKIESVVDTLNDAAKATDDEIGAAGIIADKATKGLGGFSDVVLAKHTVDMLTKRFKNDTKNEKYSGTLESVVASWAIDKDIDPMLAELVCKFCTAEFHPYSTIIKYASIESTKKEVAPYLSQISMMYQQLLKDNQIKANPNSNIDRAIYDSFVSTLYYIIDASIYDDLLIGKSEEDIIAEYSNISLVCSNVLTVVSESLAKTTGEDPNDILTVFDNALRDYSDKAFAEFAKSESNAEAVTRLISENKKKLQQPQPEVETE